TQLQPILLTLLGGVLAQPQLDYTSRFCKEKGPRLFSKGCTSNATVSAAVFNGCEGLANGMFKKEPCSSFFLTCSGDVSRIMICPSKSVFDKK
ncbi:unnamed protein product, partial [Nippostrongylus brasiliensis]|uniref:Chitin-binding type-2 domain-containing protein n=1 Tax=Nippostrongylus brasiliensis TaxID=27835 RepID=A0A0N4XG76_NIPBR